MLSMVLEFAAGFALAALTLHDVFDTAVVPGESRGPLRLSRRLTRLGLPVSRRGGKGIGPSFAPTVLVAAFVGWMLLLLLAFGSMSHALRGSFEPPLRSFGDALYRAGGAMTTMGLGRVDASGAAAAVAVASGFCSLAVMTLAVTYLLEVQSNIAQRDTGVLKMVLTAGQPPAALAMLERHAALGNRGELAEILAAGRNWCAAVLQSHASHPSLIYFRSIGVGAGWPAALGALMDLALIFELLVDEPRERGPAVLLREQAHRLAHDVCALLDLDRADRSTSASDVQALCERLAAAGYRLREPLDADAFAAARDAHTAPIAALADHLGTARASLLPSPAGDGERS